jgi:microcystin-dependent protein
MASIIRHYELPTVHQIGDTKMSALDFDHAGWLMCDGRLLDNVIYKYLYDIIGTAFGVSGETHFRIPKAAGRVAAAIGSAGPGMNDWKMGDVSGEEKHTLTISEMPAHSHPNNSSTTLGLMSVTGGNTASNGLDNSATEADLFAQPSAVVINPTGDGQPHNTIQPTIYVGNMFIFGGF